MSAPARSHDRAATTPAAPPDGGLIERGRAVLRMEREALAEVERRLGDGFARAVRMLADCAGQVIVSGVGKSGIIGRKIAATLTSTGTPAIFVHPVESLHGDLGIVGTRDIAILLSKSGETEELFPLLEALKRVGVHVIAFTGNAGSTLARHAEVVLDTWVREEACPHDLAPTTSTTAALALGDALAIALLETKGFTAEDFARLHPGGSLGRQLLTRVADVMVAAPLRTLSPSATMRDAVTLLGEMRGTLPILGDDGRVVGVLTDGDMRRLMRREEHFLPVPVADVMNRSPKLARAGDLASSVVYQMETHGIMAMPVLDEAERLVGVVHLHDLMRARVV